MDPDDLQLITNQKIPDVDQSDPVHKPESMELGAKIIYYNLNDKITSVKKWIEKKLENEYIRYFKYDEFIIDEEEIGKGRDIRIPMVLSSYFGRHFGKVSYLFLPSFNKWFLTIHFFLFLGGSFVFLVTIRPLDA
ncbi:hypothetical protein GLOIN_2v1475533 [Rhizophagus irregularis DAOM 181602=DAOM 197198]|uniref:Uncharacterized protein n=1 Tax=Rhizophagus irregularis (strain DAOM 181602 / DAOM 197198 / MUCL 43194) TaxID=747089 RepID=A0A2P4QCD5_RHIID|nr:hypothetical protein GLOIN_2v1475533 [Rhizophagus irregularis DAOM 181602=DAOM 197198]POG75297.1 hypothetical protein GLOIN_2v1475533 [Rhizophagus irregularis DAOM 181602=DAOM 197198]GET58665.1 hypothetical protein GLOIN_2v1475533 [Rhizophagus irregularis DAOM 181602=DAOM 197198]|eukprot:XP_025182163.1 hypothetical protein GLOIN_2v1475533 [Rhizophagus irregularis DAOM 181602=DAOM 197198]